MEKNLTRELAEYFATVTWEGLPESTKEAVRRIVVDAVGCALLGNRVHDAEKFDETVRRIAGPGRTTVIGGEPGAPAAACLLNGYLVTAATICDVHLETQCHVCPEVVPPAFALAEEHRSTGAALMSAIAVGLEATVRIGRALQPPVMRGRGWHSPGLIGPLGGAVAGAHLLGLGIEGTVAALGLAGSQAAGTFAQWGTLTVKFHQARGALAALLATELAADGFTSASDVLTCADGGLFTTYSNGGDPAVATQDLGKRFELERIALRAWPAGAYVQGVATAVDGLLATSPPPGVPREIHVALGERSYALHGSMPWQSSFSARLSAPYVAAVGLLDKTMWLDQFSDERVNAADVNAVASGVRIERDTSLPGGGARVSVTWADGTVATHEASTARGEPDLPLNEDEVRAKFIRCGEGCASQSELEDLVERLWHLELEPDASAVIGLLQRLATRREIDNG